MTTIKLKWRVSEPPSGRYRSFDKRSWPSADFHGTDHPAASISCEDEYVPSKIKNGDHKPLTIRITDRREKSWQWRTLKQRANTLQEAKDLAEQFFNDNPEFLPPELRPTSNEE